jgi:hypothetical protein
MFRTTVFAKPHQLLINKNPTNKCLFLASVGLTIKRAVHLALWEGSFLLSSLFDYFFDNEKSKKKKERFPLVMICNPNHIQKGFAIRFYYTLHKSNPLKV